MSASALRLEMNQGQHDHLVSLSKSTAIAHRIVVQSKALLDAAAGMANEAIARKYGTTPDTVRRWRARFAVEGVGGVGVVKAGRGRKPWLPDGTVAAVVADTRLSRPDDDSTCWSTRTMAARHEISHETVARIWRENRLKPWRVEGFKLSNDPDFEAKVVDVVALYMDPPGEGGGVLVR